MLQTHGTVPGYCTMWVLGIWTQVLVLAGQALYWLSHVLSLSEIFWITSDPSLGPSRWIKRTHTTACRWHSACYHSSWSSSFITCCLYSTLLTLSSRQRTIRQNGSQVMAWKHRDLWLQCVFLTTWHFSSEMWWFRVSPLDWLASSPQDSGSPHAHTDLLIVHVMSLAWEIVGLCGVFFSPFLSVTGHAGFLFWGEQYNLCS